MGNFNTVENEALRIPLGKEFEGDIISLMRDVLGSDCKSLAGTQKDYFEGTDIELYGVPCDITVNFDGKDFTERLPVEFDIDMASVFFGVRTENIRKVFENPVLVIGVDAGDNHSLRYHYETIISSFKRHLNEIIETGQDAYWNWIDEHDVVTA